MVVPGLIQQEGAWAPLSNAKWLPLIKKILGQDACLRHAGVIMAMPNAVAQKWHSDGDHIDDDADCRSTLECLRAVGPLRRFKWGHGVRSGRTPTGRLRPIRMCWMRPGDALVADWRLKHRLANRTREDRPLLYLTYARPWFVDKRNFSSERYAPLPPLASLDATRSERADIRDMA